MATFLGAILASAPATAQIITNGDFETGDFTGWTVQERDSVVDGTAPLDGSLSLVQTPGGASQARQSFRPVTGLVTTTFTCCAAVVPESQEWSVSFR